MLQTLRLLVRVFIDSDNDGIHDADDAFPMMLLTMDSDDGVARYYVLMLMNHRYGEQ